MSGHVPFHLTRMGVRFFEATVPELVRQLTRLNDLLEKVVDRQRARSDSAPMPGVPERGESDE